MGGEHSVDVFMPGDPNGSSPRWAGNTNRKARNTIYRTDHPRVGGEHPSSESWTCESPGSSPRGRGTHVLQQGYDRNVRIIPAWAGNTSTRRSSPAISTDHPRVGGEHTNALELRRPPIGSSPRGRGTQTVGDACSRHTSDHPRVGGEHRPGAANRPLWTGSSPRGRGTLFQQLHDLPKVSLMSKSYQQTSELRRSARTRSR